MALNNRRKALRRGTIGEMVARFSLRVRGYKIVSQNFRTKSGEIDIIAKKNNLVAMVEVKARDDVQTAIDAVDAGSQKRIINAANLWLSRQRNFAELSIRFDIVAIVPKFGIGFPWPVHYPDAF